MYVRKGNAEKVKVTEKVAMRTSVNCSRTIRNEL